ALVALLWRPNASRRAGAIFAVAATTNPRTKLWRGWRGRPWRQPPAREDGPRPARLALLCDAGAGRAASEHWRKDFPPRQGAARLGERRTFPLRWQLPTRPTQGSPPLRP